MKKITLVLILVLSTYSLSSQEKQYSFTVDQAIEYALNNNYTVLTADLDIEASEKKKWETTAMGLPQIDGNVNYQNYLKQQVTLLPSEIVGGPPGEFVEVTFGTKQNLVATGTLSQMLFDGSYLVGLQSLKTYLMISNLAKEKTEQKVREAVINSYGNVLLARETTEILKKNQESLRKNLKETIAILKNGLAEEQDVEQLQITLSTIENQLNKSLRYTTIAEKMFNLTLGIPIETPVTLTENLELLALNYADMDLINSDFVIDNHIDFKIADIQVVSDEILLKYEKSKSLPTLNAFVNYSAMSYNDQNKIFYDGNGDWFGSSLFGMNLSIPIFSSLQRSARTKQAQISLEQSQILREETSEKLKLAVLTAKNSYQFSLDQYQTSKENLVLAESIANKEQIKFFEGLSSSFNLTNAQNQLYQKQQDYIQSILTIIQSKVELENALNKY